MQLKNSITTYFKNHYGSIVLILVGLTIYCVLTWYRKDVCLALGCTNDLRSFVLDPLREAGLILAAVGLPFLFISKTYFIIWFKWMFIPLVILTSYDISQANPYSSNLLARTPAYSLEVTLPYYFILTLGFIACHYILIKKMTYKYIWLALIVTVSISSIFLTDPFLRNGLLN
jgi:hypothetical protein